MEPRISFTFIQMGLANWMDRSLTVSSQFCGVLECTFAYIRDKNKHMCEFEISSPWDMFIVKVVQLSVSTPLLIGLR